MKRNSVFTKLFAVVLCLAMAVCCLPLSAFAANDWEGDIDVVEPAGPATDANLKFMRTSLSFQDYVGIQNIFLKSSVTGYSKFYVETSQVTPEGVVEAVLEGNDLGSVIMFDTQILAWSMTEEVTITLCAETAEGTKYVGQTITTSVEQLALSKIAEYKAANNTKACAALVDMLNYGAAVQIGYNHNATSVPSAGEYASLGTSTTPAFNATNTTEGTGSIAVFRDAISMQSKVEIQIIFRNVDLTGCELRSTVAGTTTVISASEFSDLGYGILRASVPVKAANMREVHTIALYNANGEVVTTVYNVSVEAYAGAQVGGQYNDVVIALMRYGDSVAAL